MTNIIDLQATREARATRHQQNDFATTELHGETIVVYADRKGKMHAFTEEQFRRASSPRICDLPFVSKERNQYGHPVSYWAVEGDDAGTFERGQEWGRALFDVLVNHGNRSCE